MKRILLVLLSLFLTSCSIFGEKSSNDSQKSEDANQSATNETIRIEREKEYEVVDETYVFTNSLHRFIVIKTDKDGEESKVNGSYCRWSLKDRDMGSLDSSGGLTPNKNGQTILTATLGNLTASIDIKIATYAKTYELDTNIKEYRKNNTYDMPFTMTANYQNNNPITIFYTLSNDNVIKVNESTNKFTVIEAGSVDVHAEFYINSRGEKERYDFTINTTIKDAPYFKFKNGKALTGEGSVAKNKYTSIPFSSLGITAYTNDGENISNLIKVDSGDYDLTQAGVYNVKLSVTDSHYNATSYFILDLEVTEYELKATLSPIDAVSYSNYKMKKVSDRQYSLAIDRLEFECDVTLNDKYDASDATVYCSFCFEIKNWGKSITYDKLGGADSLTQKFTMNGPRTVHFNYTFDPVGDLDPDTFIEYGPNVYIGGNVYNYIYY